MLSVHTYDAFSMIMGINTKKPFKILSVIMPFMPVLKYTLTIVMYACLLLYNNFVNSDTNPNYWQLPIPLQGNMPKTYNHPIFEIEPEKCGVCHPKIYNQWKSSFHAHAVSPGLLGQLEAFDEEIKNDCLNCHAPRSEQQKLIRDNDSQIQGIDCSACHLRKHTHYGPKTNSFAPHGEVKNLTLIKKSDFCVPCHQFAKDGILVNGKPLENTFEEWKSSRYARQGIRCQSCHMRNNHSFKGIHDKKMTREGLQVKVTRNQSGIQLLASNVGAGHALPTYITPRIRLRIVTTDGTKEIEHIIQRSMQWSIKNGWKEIYDTRLLPDQSVTLKLALSSKYAAKVEVIVEPDADYYERIYPLLIEQLVEELDSRSMEQLKLAKDCSGESIYVLYSYDCLANTNTCVENNP